MNAQTTGTEGAHDTTTDSRAPGTEDGQAGVGDATSIAKNDAFHVLQNARRRAVLRYILEHPDQERFRMRDLAEEVAAWEHETTVRQLSSDERQRVYIALYQSHLPKLDDHGVIDYNQSRGIVEPTSLVGAFAPFLEDGLHAETDRIAANGTDGTEGGVTGVVSALFAR